MQQEIVREVDGTVRLGETKPIPFRISTTTAYNDYCPTPLEEGSEEYDSVFIKLNGLYTGPDRVSLPNGKNPKPETETPADGGEGETPSGGGTTETPPADTPSEPPAETPAAPPAAETPAE
jgi:hypothetical protein